jgi:hypothetical protein
MIILETPSSTGAIPSSPKIQSTKQESLRKEEEPQLKPSQTKDEEVSIDDDDDDLMFDEEEFESVIFYFSSYVKRVSE